MKKILFILSFLLFANFVEAQTGIGTTTPAVKLHVKSNGSILRLEGSDHAYMELFPQGSTTRYGYIGFPNASSTQLTFMNQFATGPIVFGTNGSNKMFLSSDGKLSIGTITPASTLTVGAADGSVAGEILLNPTSTQYEGGQLIIKRSLIGSTVDWTIDQYGTTSSNARLRIFNGNSEINGIAILENGNVGFGTATPSAKLNLSGGGIRIHTGFGNSTSRPALNTSTIGNYEIRGTGGFSQLDATDDGFLRLSAGGGTSSGAQVSIDLSGYSQNSEMNNNIVMRTVGVERFRIDEYGRTGIGTSSPWSKLHVQSSDGNTVYIESTTADNNGMMVLNANTSQNWSANWHEFIYFRNQGNNIGSIIGSNGGNMVSFNTSSDYRLKTDLKGYNGLDLVNKIKTYDYAWKRDSSRMYGFVAHELQEVIPYLVSGKKDAVDANGKIIPQSVDYSKLTPILVKAIQEQDIKIKEQEESIKKLNDDNRALEQRITFLENLIKSNTNKN